MLVNVCEGFENEQGGFWRVFPSVVRLQSLYDCDCFKGNSPKTFSPYLFVEKARLSAIGNWLDVVGSLSVRMNSHIGESKDE